MSKKITFNLSARSVRSAMKELEKYKRDLLRKCEIFCETLANKGILVAQMNTGEYGRYITFSVQTEPKRTGARALLIATNTGHIVSQWQTKEGVQEADVSPLMMAEFGSGLRANLSQNPKAAEFGMGTGTFPDQTHAEDPNGWWYMDLEGEWHHSYGVYPTMPMWNAHEEMYDQIASTAREVFGS